MNRSLNLLALTSACFLIVAPSNAWASHGNSGKHAHGSNPLRQILSASNNKVVTGNRGGMGFIADPARRFVKPQQSGGNVTKITDPIPVKGLPGNGGQVVPTNTAQPLLIAIKPAPTGSGPVVRDHKLTKPPVKTNPYANPPTVTGGTGYHFVNPFSFTAPLQPGQQGVDHRTPSGYRGGGHGQGGTEWQPNTQGPANHVKPLIPPKPSGK